MLQWSVNVSQTVNEKRPAYKPHACSCQNNRSPVWICSHKIYSNSFLPLNSAVSLRSGLFYLITLGNKAGFPVILSWFLKISRTNLRKPALLDDKINKFRSQERKISEMYLLVKEKLIK